jgi:predicted hotdog family 3-hydroxylacyl-ACP dehydratase
MVDAAIASIAENHSRLPHLSTSELMASTWSNLSRSISTGMIASTKMSEVRITGLEKSGELQILDSSVMDNCGDVDGILMTF